MAENFDKTSRPRVSGSGSLSIKDERISGYGCKSGI